MKSNSWQVSDASEANAYAQQVMISPMTAGRSTISITALLETDVKVDFTVSPPDFLLRDERSLCFTLLPSGMVLRHWSILTPGMLTLQVQHYASLEGDQLHQYRVVSIVGLVLAVVILVEKILTSQHKEFRKPGPDGELIMTMEGRSNLQGFVVDFLIQVQDSGNWNPTGLLRHTKSH